MTDTATASAMASADPPADLAAVLALGCLAPRLPWSEMRAALAGLDDEAAAGMAGQLSRARAALVADAALGQVGGEVPGAAALRRALAPHVERMAGRRAQIARSLEILEPLAKDLGMPVWGIKGLASRAVYPDPAVRDLRDVDVSVRTAPEAFLLAAQLRRRGFQTDRWELPWLKRDRDGRIYGQYKLVGPDGVASIDIHFGPWYSTGHCGVLPVRLPDDAPGLRLLDPVANLRPMLGNSGGDCAVTCKDVNDLWLLAERLTDPEAEAFQRDAAAAALDGHLADVAAAALHLAECRGRRRQVLVRLAGPRAGDPAGVRLRPERREVVAVTARRAFRQAAQHGGGWPRRLAAAVGAAVYYGAPLALRSHPLPAAAATAAPWRCVRLVPVELARWALDGSAEAMRRWPGDAVAGGASQPVCAAGNRAVAHRGGALVTPDGAAFVPTVWYALSQRRVRAAARQVPAAPTGGGLR